MTIKVINDKEEIPRGSAIKVDKETKRHYYGLHCSMEGTWKVKLKKDNCEVLANRL